MGNIMFAVFMITIAIVLIVIITSLLITNNRNKQAQLPDHSRGKEKKIKQSYMSGEGEFYIQGKKNYFTIRKNDQFEFLVKDGQIVACKDKQHGADFVYYGGEQ